MSEKKENSTLLSTIFDFVSVFATAVVAVSFVFSFLFRTVGVVGSSMLPTLHNGDRIVLTAFEYTPEYGDVVVTCQPSKNPAIEDVLVKQNVMRFFDLDFLIFNSKLQPIQKMRGSPFYPRICYQKR